MFETVFVLSVMIVIILVKYFEKRMNYVYAYAGVGIKRITEEKTKGTIFFLRSNESYSSRSDVKKILNKKLEFGGEEQLKNAEQQEKLNHSERVREVRKKQRKQERKRNILRAIRSLSIKDYVTIFIYMGLPIVCILFLNYSEWNAYFSEVIAGISNHRVDIYLSQLSLTFITISLMSIFSDSNAIIYWENIVKRTLIEPPASCFKAYFSYSFIYLLFSTVVLVLRNDVGIGVFFVFNILCLFDLSRIMINCYYDPKRKKKKVVKDFIKKIEKANIESLQRNPENSSTEYTSEVKSVFEDFNYYINEAYTKGKYSDVKECLGVYGKLLAHVDSATVAAKEFTIIDWYNEKTHQAYKNLVKSYYEECNSIVLGLSNTNGQPISTSSLSIEKNIINNIKKKV